LPSFFYNFYSSPELELRTAFRITFLIVPSPQLQHFYLSNLHPPLSLGRGVRGEGVCGDVTAVRSAGFSDDCPESKAQDSTSLYKTQDFL
jgi:hypothetical protein